MERKKITTFLNITVCIGMILYPIWCDDTTLTTSLEVHSEPDQGNEQRCLKGHCFVQRKDIGILVVSTEWWPESGNHLWNTVQRDVATLLGRSGYSVHVTVFDASKDEVEDAKSRNVNLIVGKGDGNGKTRAERLLLHRYFFPELQKLEKISFIIGFVNREHLESAARSIQEECFKSASFVPFLTYISRDTDMNSDEIEDDEYDIINHTEKAIFIVSVGPRIHLHFKQKFHDENSKEHLQFLPSVDEMVLRTNVSCQALEGNIEFLTFDFVSKNVSDCQKNSKIAALIIGKIANDLELLEIDCAWKIRGLHRNISSDCVDALKVIAHSPNLSIYSYVLKPDILKRVIDDLKQCHLHIFAPVHDPFGIMSLMSIAAGIPTLSTKHSGFSAFVKQNMKNHYRKIVVGNYGKNENESKIADIWKEKVKDIIGNEEQYAAFVNNAKILQKELNESINYGTIAASQKQLSNMFTKYMIAGEHSSAVGRSSSESINDGESQPFKNMGEDVSSLRSIQVDVLPDNKAPEKMTIINAALLEIQTCSDLYTLQSYLQNLGIECQYISHHSLSILLLCPSVESLEILWASYKNGSIARMIRKDVLRNTKMNLDVEEIALRTIIETWRYHRCKLELSFYGKDSLGNITTEEHGERVTCAASVITICTILGTLLCLYNQKPTNNMKTVQTAKVQNIDALEDIQPNFEMKRTTLESQLKEAKEEKATLKERCNELRQKLESNEQSSSVKQKTWVSELKEKKKQIKELQDKVAELEHKLEQSELKKSGDKALEDIQSKFDIERAILESQMKKANEEKATLEERCKELRQKLASNEQSSSVKQNILLSELEEKKKQINELQNKVAELEHKLEQSELKKSGEKALGDIQSKFEMERATLESQLKVAKEEKATLEERCKEVTEKLESTESLVSQRIENSVERDKLESELKENQKLVKELQHKVDELEYKLELSNLKKAGEKGDWSFTLVDGQHQEQGIKFKTPRGLIFHLDKLVVCDRGDNIVQILNKDYTCDIVLGSFDGQFAKPFRPLSVAISHLNHYFVLDDANKQIVVCDENGKIIQIITLPENIKVVWDIALMDDFLFVTLSFTIDRNQDSGDRLVKYTQKGEYVADFGDTGDYRTEFAWPVSVAVNSNKVILVYDRGNSCIKWFDSDLNFLYQFGQSQLSGIRIAGYKGYIAVDEDDNVYVSDVSDRIRKFRCDGKWICDLFTGKVTEPVYIAVMGDKIGIVEWGSDKIKIFLKKINTQI